MSRDPQIMGYVFDVIHVPAVSLAVTETFVTVADIPAQIARMFDIVYAWLPDSGLHQVGHKYAIYDQFRSDGMRMRVGFPVSASFKNTQTVSCLSLGDCLAAHTMHRGPYEGLPAAHAALNQWCNDQGFTRRGFAWEVYGDWNEDQSKLTTNIYTTIAEES